MSYLYPDINNKKHGSLRGTWNRKITRFGHINSMKAYENENKKELLGADATAT